MTPKPRPKTKDTPHLLVTLGGVLIAFTMIYLAMKTTLVPRALMVAFAISFAVVFRWASRWSAKAVRERRERELAELRSRPILRLND
jgi:putative flippase GtrA